MTTDGIPLGVVQYVSTRSVHPDALPVGSAMRSALRGAYYFNQHNAQLLAAQYFANHWLNPVVEQGSIDVFSSSPVTIADFYPYVEDWKYQLRAEIGFIRPDADGVRAQVNMSVAGTAKLFSDTSNPPGDPGDIVTAEVQYDLATLNAGSSLGAPVEVLVQFCTNRLDDLAIVAVPVKCVHVCVYHVAVDPSGGQNG